MAPRMQVMKKDYPTRLKRLEFFVLFSVVLGFALTVMDAGQHGFVTAQVLTLIFFLISVRVRRQADAAEADSAELHSHGSRKDKGAAD